MRPVRFLFVAFLFECVWGSKFVEEVWNFLKKASTETVEAEKAKKQLASLARQKKLFFPEALLFNLRNRVGGAETLEPGSVSRKLRNDISDLKTRYYENGSLVYIEEFFDPAFFGRLVKESGRLWRTGEAEIEGNCNLDGRNRMGGYLKLISDHTESFYNLIYGNEELLETVSEIVGRNFYPADFPIELREYGRDSAGMPCHKDLLMYKDADGDLEVVVTLSHEDHSQCEFVWFDRKNQEHRVRTQPNSLAIVKPNAAMHCVSDTAGGTREILKFILVSDYTKPVAFGKYARNECDKKTSENHSAIRTKSGQMTSFASDEL